MGGDLMQIQTDHLECETAKDHYENLKKLRQLSPSGYRVANVSHNSLRKQRLKNISPIKTNVICVPSAVDD